MGRRRDYEQIYNESVRGQRKRLEEFITRCTDDAHNLMYVYKYKKCDMPDDEYRSAVYFINKEYENKADALLTLCDIEKRLYTELPPTTIENVIEKMRFRFKIFTKLLTEGGY